MTPSNPAGPCDGFTTELLRTGCDLTSLAADLIEALPADAYPGEEPAQVVLEMVSGSIRSFLSEADEAEVARATELMAGAVD